MSVGLCLLESCRKFIFLLRRMSINTSPSPDAVRENIFAQVTKQQKLLPTALYLLYFQRSSWLTSEQITSCLFIA